jgi:small-conductance mechanosensitive channel
MTIIETLKQEETAKRIRFVLKLFAYLGIIIFLRNYPNIYERWGLPDSLVSASLFYFSGHLLISFGRLIAVFLYLRRYHIQKTIKNNFIIGINRIADVLGIFIFLFSLLLLWGKNPVEFITSLSIVAAAIAILSKDYISNMINGMIMMFSNEITIGDDVKIGNNKGKIVDLTLVNVHMVNEDEDLIFIPNNVVMNSETINFTKRSVRKLSFEFDLKNHLLNSIEDLERYLFDALTDYHSYIKEETFTIKVVKIHENFTSLKVQFVIAKSVNATLEKDIRKKTLRSVLAYAN